jgi:hypothetical protein
MRMPRIIVEDRKIEVLEDGTQLFGHYIRSPTVAEHLTALGLTRDDLRRVVALAVDAAHALDDMVAVERMADVLARVPEPDDA